MKIFLLTIGLLGSIYLTCFGQRQSANFSLSIYEEIKASELERSPNDFHLSGKVRKVIESTMQGDSSFLEFNLDGRLELEERKSRNDHWKKSFLFDRMGSLATIIEIPNMKINHQRIHSFRNGWLEKLESRNETVPDNIFSYRVSYSDNRKNIRFDYTFPHRNPQYVYIKEFNYTLTIGDKGEILNQKEMTITSESTYGSNKSFIYDSLGQKTAYSLIDFCAGSNSCLIVQGRLSYDTWGNIIAHTQTDQTIRNSVWSYSFANHYLYDSRGCLLGENEENLSAVTTFQDNPTTPVVPVQFCYEFDKMGNWIVKYKIEGSKKERFAIRKIKYWE